jgi:hypothetical protein
MVKEKINILSYLILSGAGSIPLTNGSGRPKDMRIRIPNTDFYILKIEGGKNL